MRRFRWFCRSMFALSLCVISVGMITGNGFADEKVVNVSGWGGALQKLFIEAIGPDLEKQTGAKIVYTPGKAAETLAKIQAQRSRPQIDVAITTEVVGLQGANLGLWAPLDPSIVTNMKDMYDYALYPDNKGVLWSANISGIAYNPEALRENGITPPDSYFDLFKEQYKGKIVVGTITTDYGLLALLIMAKIHGGSERDIDPGFKAMKKLAPSVLSFEKIFSRVGELFQSKTAWIAPWNHAGVFMMSKQGIPIKYVAPKEGVIISANFVGLVNNAPHPKDAQVFINLLLGSKVLEKFAETYSTIPLNKAIKLKPEVEEYVPNKPEIMNKVLPIDWQYVNEHRGEWTERWFKEVESVASSG